METFTRLACMIEAQKGKYNIFYNAMGFLRKVSIILVSLPQFDNFSSKYGFFHIL